MEFLARSEHRVAVLQAVAQRHHTRGELSDATGASQATLGRIIEDFRSRSWIQADERGYVATATGRLVAEATTELLTTLGTEQKLRDVVAYLPTDAIGVDLTRFEDATITVPTQTRPSAPLQRVLEQMESAERLRAFSHSFNGRSLTTIANRVTDGSQTFNGVFGDAAVEALAADNELWTKLTELAAHDDATVRVRSAGVPVAATVSDGVVALLLRDDDGVVRAAVESTDPMVREWAIDTFDRYWETATPLDPAEYSSA